MTSESTTIDPTSVLAPEFTEARRTELIEKIGLIIPFVDTATWSLLWLADIERLEYLANLQKGFLTKVLESPNYGALLKWASRMRAIEDPEKTTPPTKKRKRRSESVKEMCLERDQCCILTKKDEPLEIAHIYPFSMAGRPRTEQQAFWDGLTTWWTEEEVAEWEKELTGPEGTEVIQNELCLSCDSHALWGKARFVLQPLELSDDRKVLKARFFWLPIFKYSNSIDVTTRPSLPSNLSFVGKRIKLFNCKTAAQIHSGDIITMETINADTHPLPSIKLLNMQFALTRALGMSGAADVDPDQWDNNDSDDSDEEEEEELKEELVEELVAQPRGRAPNLQENQHPSRAASRMSSKATPGSRDTSRSFSRSVRRRY
ncbi:hypothetical protein BDV38DRAFT_10807 [Aspergillus pseudotamarii]|uniref:HNH nuclease domain-containing protein n=1 Tax=Aspergillus pseudotamarii TaxID=132259 RepID=A0A5N6T3L5_ASPPS|nr:uncharacterized protein BDV38DRAFT_10807 [Aspergillus pseudotamarii]KAE8140859.1 hypothetical protein BDV38DRAFT_10807 [Aspergillus pseudotamarii]